MKTFRKTRYYSRSSSARQARVEAVDHDLDGTRNVCRFSTELTTNSRVLEESLKAKISLVVISPHRMQFSPFKEVLERSTLTEPSTFGLLNGECMLKQSGSGRQSEGTSNEARWVCNLAEGLLGPVNIDRFLRRPRCEGPRYSELGLPELSDIPISRHLLDGHPLKDFISKVKPLSCRDLEAILRDPRLDLSLVGFHTGTVTAAIHKQLMTASRVGVEDYSRNMWARDGIITATALNRAGFSDKARQIIRNLWSFAGQEGQREKIVQFHWGGPDVARRLFLDGNNGPHIKYSVNAEGRLETCNHDWGHQQLDALGAMVWAPYRFANQATKNPREDIFNLRDLDPMPWATDSILPAAIKMLHGVQAHDTLDYGPWEDIRQWRRATSVGIVVAALHEARIYHDRHGWDCLPVEYNGKQDGASFRDQLMTTLYNCLATVQARIPEFGLATECDRRPCDSAMTLLLYPFDCNLKIERQNTILRTVYRNMGENGFRRWDADCEEGPDTYVGQDYFRNRDPKDKGEFAKVCDGFRPAEWTLFDPLLAAYFYRRFVKSGGSDLQAFSYGDRHLKRCLSFITPQSHELYVVGKGQEYQIPGGVLPEAFAWDTERCEWRPNHNSPLLMAQAALGLAFERAREACALVEHSGLSERQ
ncbi:MAG: hypothetical protein RL518_942 [Pseudomonadota bacterium]|jgi:hypothetical protein